MQMAHIGNNHCESAALYDIIALENIRGTLLENGKGT